MAQCNLNRLALPPEVEVVVLVADADPVGEQAAGRAKVVYLESQDINDLLRRAPATVSAA